MTHFLPVLYAFAACASFCPIFNIRGKNMLYAALGGALGWLIYLLSAGHGTDIFQYFVASIAISAYAEIVARIRKSPSTCYLIIALLPLVPGGGVYYTMKSCIQGQFEEFADTGMHTLLIAGAIALGVLWVISMVRLLIHFELFRMQRKKTS